MENWKRKLFMACVTAAAVCTAATIACGAVTGEGTGRLAAGVIEVSGAAAGTERMANATAASGEEASEETSGEYGEIEDSGEAADRPEEASEELEISAEAVGESLFEDLDLRAAQESLDDLLGKNNFSLGGTIQKLVQGEIPWSAESLLGILKDALFQEMQDYRKTAVYLLALIVAAAVFTNFITVFDKGQIADISYYTMYLLMITLLMKVFASMSQVAQSAVTAILNFMQALLPACMLTLYLSSGSLTAMGFYQITLVALAGVQGLINYLLLPGVQIYVILLFINQLMKEDYLSKMAELIKTAILWILKTVMAVLFGMQAIQCMAAPAVDQMKTSVVNKAVSVIPGIGGAYETVAQTVLGSAVVLKNAVGIAGVAALVFLGLVPVMKLAWGVLLYRALGAVAQPVSDKRVAECIGSVAEGGELLLKIVLHAGTLFVISLAMITVMVRGG